MKLNILFGGKAGQGPNIAAHILSELLTECGIYIFNSRDYESLIRGGHNFNLLTLSDEAIFSNEAKIDILLAMDFQTKFLHEKELKENALIFEEEKENIYLLGKLVKLLGLNFNALESKLKNLRNFEKNIHNAKEGYNSSQTEFNLPFQTKKFSILNGNQAVAQGAIDSKIRIYFAYPMTPATGVMNELAAKQSENNLIVFQSENEIAAINSALGASFVGARAMTGSSGGGFDLMAEALSLQGQTEIPLVVYLASRPGPSTGIPTYTSQSDLNSALYSGHGEFPRIVIAPGDPEEAVEKTNEAFYLSEKFKTLSIILSDKHLAESEYTLTQKPSSKLTIEIKRKLPGKEIIKASSYEHDEAGISTELHDLAKENADKRLNKLKEIQEELKNFKTFKLHGNKESRNLVIGWGSTKGAILDAIKNLNAKFLQIIYLNPFSEEIKEEIKRAEKIILVENNSTAQLRELITQKTGMQIQEKILKYDGRPFFSDELKKQIQEKINEN